MSTIQYFDNVEQKLEQIRTDEFYRPYLEELKRLYEEDKNADIYMDYASFMCFYTTGSRTEYENKYAARRRKLTESLMLSLLYEEQEYLDALCSIIWDICNQLTWVYPAHLSDVKVEHYRTHIDLASSAMAHSLAEADYLMGDRLPSRIRELIRQEIKERIFDPFESRPYFWEKLKTNWSGVCGSGVAMAYMYLAPERFDTLKDRFADCMGNFMDSYGEDGSNTEGISYWQFGLWRFLNYAEMLYRYSGKGIDLIHGEKMDKMVRFPQKILMRDYITVSFSDSSRYFSFNNIGLFCYLTKQYKDIEFPMPQSKEFTMTGYADTTTMIRNFLWSDPNYLMPSGAMTEGMEYLEDAQWYMVKKKNYSFAAKCGHNDEGHNHNDIGNFIVATDKGQMIADMGAMEYTAICFSKYRYTLIQNSSLGHSVPIIDGKEQGPGIKYRGKVCEVSENVFSMEIQGAYETDIAKIERRFDMEENGITLTDTYEEIEGHEITERFVTMIEPEIVGNAIRIGDVTLITKDLPAISKEIVSAKQGLKELWWLIDYPVKDKEFVLKVEV